MTSFVFRVRNVPAALYKALGGFATNGVNMTKLESYLVGGRFNAARSSAEVEGHPEHKNLTLALEELDFFSAKSAFSAFTRSTPTDGRGREPERASRTLSLRRETGGGPMPGDASSVVEDLANYDDSEFAVPVVSARMLAKR